MAEKRHLRTGFTTGTCASAAAKGALLYMFNHRPPSVPVTLPDGQCAEIPVHNAMPTAEGWMCEVVKDAGDDPDVTAGAVIRSEAKIIEKSGILISGGDGVGIVTRPGLAVPVGEPAINPVPRTMIAAAAAQVLPADYGAEIAISVPGGELIAEKTLNRRLGIIGGISILGTTGRVIPYSHAAYRESIVCALDVACASGIEHVVFSTGKASEQNVRTLYPDLGEAGFVLMADYFMFALKEAQKHGVRRISVSCFPAKLLKMASGAASTHCSKSQIDLGLMAELCRKEGLPEADAVAVRAANTVRHACGLAPFPVVQKVCARLAEAVCRRIRQAAGRFVIPEVIVFSYSHEILFKGGY